MKRSKGKNSGANDGRLEAAIERMAKEIARISREQVEMRREQVEMRKEMVEMRKDLKGVVDLVNLTAGRFQTRAGRFLENTIAGAIRFSLGIDVDPKSIKLRQKVCAEGREKEVDIMCHDGSYYLIETSSYADEDKVEAVEERAEMARKHYGLDKIKKVLITLDRDERVVMLCEERGIILVP